MYTPGYCRLKSRISWNGWFEVCKFCNMAEIFQAPSFLICMKAMLKRGPNVTIASGHGSTRLSLKITGEKLVWTAGWTWRAFERRISTRLCVWFTSGLHRKVGLFYQYDTFWAMNEWERTDVLKVCTVTRRSCGYPPTFVKRIARGPLTTHQVSVQFV